MPRTVLSFCFSPGASPLRFPVLMGLCLTLSCARALPTPQADSPEKNLPAAPASLKESPPPPEGALTFRKALMGTVFTLTLLPESGKNSPEMETAASDAFARAEQLQRTASTFDAESELSRFNTAPPRQDIPLSPGLFSLLSRAREIAVLSGGAFDPTLGAESRLWRRARSRGTIPAEEELTQARARSGYKGLLLDASKKTARKTRPGLLVDLGGIGKGAAADLMADLLKQRGFPRFKISTTSDVLVGDPPPGRAGWPIRLSHSSRTLLLKNQALSTSGTTRQNILAENTRYAHLIDPHTGFGTTRRACASIVAPDAATADAAATALIFLPVEKREKFLRSLSLANPVITENPDIPPARTDHSSPVQPKGNAVSFMPTKLPIKNILTFLHLSK